jgi:hypothetical protein
MIDTVTQAMEMMMKKFKEEFGADVKLEEGDEITGVFNDGIVIVGIEDRQLKIKVSAGEPYKFDFDLDLVEKE